MLPTNLKNYIIRKLPESRDDEYTKKIIDKFSKMYSKDYTDNLILSQEEAMKLFEYIDINKINNETFMEYYIHSTSEPENYSKDLLYGLSEIYENFKNPFWGDEYPNITDRYLQISSIEGEHSYFYDKETDAVYSVGWEEMDDFMNGKLEPRWNSFYDFLEWYYAEDDDEE